MNLQNIGLSLLGAQIIQQSSSSDSHLYSSNNLLKEQEDQIWNSGEGLPQYIVISLQNVKFKYSHLEKIGFYCWHDYTTNPKVIEVEVAQARNQPFAYWQSFTLKKQSGKQYFELSHLPSSYCIIKIVITETFGDFQTYLNQIFLLASPQDENYQPEELQVGDLDPSLKIQSEQQASQLEKQQSSIKIKKRLNDSRGLIKQKKDNSSYKVYRDNTFLNTQKYPTQKSNYERIDSTKSLRERVDVQEEELQEEEERDQSIQKNVALLTLSKNLIEMQQNIDDVRRQIEVLDLKINVSYSNLEKNIMIKVQRLIDKKLEQFRRDLLEQPLDLKESTNTGARKQAMKSKQDKHRSEQVIESTSNWKEPLSRQIKRSLHLTSLNKVEDAQRQQTVAELMNQLARKLKERAKLKKIQSKKQSSRFVHRNNGV